ncbi:vacuolar protein sorting 16B [Musca autumnalis]|uniref:vacuolar protein sorting 16B n=1 Tax=Musca autumnalis TaxID=221902 RepID=UPI003CF4F788
MEDDGYWNRSGRAFNFDDDNEDIDLKSLEISIDIGTGGGRGSGGGILNDDTISEASFDNTASTYNLSIKSLISDEELKLILDEQSMDDNMIAKGMKPEEELKLLRRQLQNTLYTPSPIATARKLLQGKLVSFEVFKSLQDKQQLLDAVIDIGCPGDSLLSVVLFLDKTLNTKDFQVILKSRPKALQHYLQYLSQRHVEAAIDLLKDLGKYNEAMLLEFQTVLRLESMTERKAKLQAMMTHCANNRVCSLYQQILHAALKLFALVEAERNNLNNMVDVNSSPVEVLYACCAKNTNWKDPDITQLISPYRLCNDQHISAGQFDWTALNERARSQAYADLQHIFEQVPTWHPIKQKQFHINISLELAVMRLHELNAPASVIYMFLSNVSSASDKLELAKRVKCTKAIIDALTTLKDVPQLLQIRDSLADRSEEQFYCDNAIKQVQTKRWTTDSIKLKL